MRGNSTHGIKGEGNWRNDVSKGQYLWVLLNGGG
jgi:hypothetical protein